MGNARLDDALDCRNVERTDAAMDHVSRGDSAMERVRRASTSRAA
jgi:hypothetical protein